MIWPRTKSSDKLVRHKTINIAKNPKYDGYQQGIGLMVYKLFDKKFSGCAVTRATKSAIKREIMPNQQLAEEFRKPIIINLKKEKYNYLLKTIFGVLNLQIWN